LRLQQLHLFSQIMSVLQNA